MREYDSEAKTSDYLTTASQVPHRDVGEALLLERLPESGAGTTQKDAG